MLANCSSKQKRQPQAAFLATYELHAVFLAELLDAAGSVDNLLLARIERMALGANFNAHVFAGRGACLELVAATASHVDFGIVWMNLGLHAGISFKAVAGNA
jgi:hypothetical protein